jgi:ribA/ribD-fused uncharacterized protein
MQESISMNRKPEIAFTKTKLPFGWMCNMSPHPINAYGTTWRTSEALFQALRFDDQSIRDMIREQTSPMAAKLKAKGHTDKMTIEPMSDLDIQNMRSCLRLKVDQHSNLKKDLLATGNAEIIEDVTKRGRRGSGLFWGAIRTEDGWEGVNMLGVLWMELRETLRSEPKSPQP